MLHIRRDILDLGLKERVMLQMQRACFGSWHDELDFQRFHRIDMFPADPMDSIGRLSNLPESIVYTCGFIL